MYMTVAIENLRRIRHLEVDDLRRVNLFAGRNNCGKTTILEGIFLLTGPTNPQLFMKINGFRNVGFTGEDSWRLFFPDLDTRREIRVAGELKNPLEKRRLAVEVCTQASAPFVPTWQPPPDDTTGVRLPESEPASAPNGLDLKFAFSKGKRGETVRFASRITSRQQGFEINMPKNYTEERRGVFVNATTLLGEIGRRFHNAQVKKRVAPFVTVLRQVEPALADLSLGAEGQVYCDVGLPHLAPLNVMGDGVVRLLSFLLSIADTENGVVLIDDIDHGFHADAQKILWRAIFEISREFNVQVIATTQSRECVESLSACRADSAAEEDESRLFLVERTENGCRSVRGGAWS
ncbi:MAG TPA: AAA family ATPase [Sumerlaeia bacterium]|nr:AAA family ATPase [Sumerlaeia bacterium]